MLASKHYNQELNYMLRILISLFPYQIVKDAAGQFPLQGIMIDGATQSETGF